MTLRIFPAEGAKQLPSVPDVDVILGETIDSATLLNSDATNSTRTKMSEFMTGVLKWISVRRTVPRIGYVGRILFSLFVVVWGSVLIYYIYNNKCSIWKILFVVTGFILTCSLFSFIVYFTGFPI